MSKECLIGNGMLPEQAEEIANQVDPVVELEVRKANAEEEKLRKAHDLERAQETLDYIELGMSGGATAAEMLRARISPGYNGTGQVDNIESVAEAYFSVYSQRLSNLIEKFRTSKSQILREVVAPWVKGKTAEQERSFVKAIFTVSRGGKLDDNPELEDLAKTWLETIELAVADFNKAAGFDAIKELKHWDLPQSWDANAVKRKFPTAQEFADWMYSRVDLQRMAEDRINRKMRVVADKQHKLRKKARKKGMSPEEIDAKYPLPKRPSKINPLTKAEADEILKESYESITQQGWNKLESPIEAGKKQAATPAKRHSQERVIHFRDGDSWYDVHEMMGREDRLFDVMMGHLDRMATDAATMEVLPPRAFEALNNYAQQMDGGGADYTQAMYNQAAGRLTPGSEQWVVGMVNTLRNLTTGIRLDAALIAAFGDVVLLNRVGTAYGLSQLRTIKTIAAGIADSFTPQALGGQKYKQLAMRNALGADAFIQGAASNMRMGEASISGWSGHLAQLVMRGTGLASWTHGLRATFKVELAGSISDQSKKSFDQLPEQLKKTLGDEYNITPDQWDAYRKQVKNEAGILPLDTAEGRPFLMLINGATNRAVVTPDTRTRAIITQGKAESDLSGALWRLGLGLKSFPISLIANNFMWAWYGKQIGGSGVNRLAYLGSTAAAMSVMGMGTTLALDYFNGKEMRDLDEEGAINKLLVEGIVRGGGLSLIGDIVFQDPNAFGAMGYLDKLGNSVMPGLGVAEEMMSPVSAGAKFIWSDDYTWDKYKVEVARDWQSLVPEPWYLRRHITRPGWDFVNEAIGGREYRKQRRRRERREQDEYGRGYSYTD